MAVKKTFFLIKWIFFRKSRKHYLCSEGTKNAHFRCNYWFWKMVLFCAHSKSPNTTKIGVSTGTGENPKWHFWLQKCHFGKGPGKGLYYLWYLQAVFCWKHNFYSVFSEHSFAEIKERNLKSKKHLPKIGGVCQHAKRCCFVLCFLLFGGLFFLCVLFLCLEKHKGYFPAMFEYVFLSPKACL